MSKGSRPYPGFNFLHYRQFAFEPDQAPKVMGQGGATVAYTQDEDGAIRFAVALCRDDGVIADNYNHKIGRDIAVGRIKADKFETFDAEIPTGDPEYVRAFIQAQDDDFAYIYGYFRRCRVGDTETSDQLVRTTTH